MSDKTDHESSAEFEAGKAHAMQAADELREAAIKKADELRHAAENRVNDLKEKATEKAEELRRAAHDRADEFRDYAEETYAHGRERLDDWRSDSEHYIRENPAKSVLIALGIGFLIGRLFK